MGDVQVDNGAVIHRMTLQLACLMGESRSAMVGRLVALWFMEPGCRDHQLAGGMRRRADWAYATGAHRVKIGGSDEGEG